MDIKKKKSAVTSCLAFEGGVGIIPNTTTVSHSHSHTLS